MNQLPPLQQFPQLLTVHEITNPKAVIGEFFMWFHLYDCKRWIRKWMGAVHINQSWKNYAPCDFLYFHEQISKLIEVCYLIDQLDNENNQAILPEQALTDREIFSQPEYYCTDKQLKNYWRYFPRALKWKEFINPYKVISAFFQLHTLGEWKERLYLLLFTALSKEDLKEAVLDINILAVKESLDKLVEASHLIYVRRRQMVPQEDAM